MWPLCVCEEDGGGMSRPRWASRAHGWASGAHSVFALASAGRLAVDSRRESRACARTRCRFLGGGGSVASARCLAAGLAPRELRVVRHCQRDWCAGRECCLEGGPIDARSRAREPERCPRRTGGRTSQRGSVTSQCCDCAGRAGVVECAFHRGTSRASCRWTGCPGEIFPHRWRTGAHVGIE